MHLKSEALSQQLFLSAELLGCPLFSFDFLCPKDQAAMRTSAYCQLAVQHLAMRLSTFLYQAVIRTWTSPSWRKTSEPACRQLEEVLWREKRKDWGEVEGRGWGETVGNDNVCSDKPVARPSRPGGGLGATRLQPQCSVRLLSLMTLPRQLVAICVEDKYMQCAHATWPVCRHVGYCLKKGSWKRNVKWNKEVGVKYIRIRIVSKLHHYWVA